MSDRRCSQACNEGRYSECTETYETCDCTFRGLHKTLHRYASVPMKPMQRIHKSCGGTILLEGDTYRCNKCGRGYKCVGQEHYLDEVSESVTR